MQVTRQRVEVMKVGVAYAYQGIKRSAGLDYTLIILV